MFQTQMSGRLESAGRSKNSTFQCKTPTGLCPEFCVASWTSRWRCVLVDPPSTYTHKHTHHICTDTMRCNACLCVFQTEQQKFFNELQTGFTRGKTIYIVMDLYVRCSSVSHGACSRRRPGVQPSSRGTASGVQVQQNAGRLLCRSRCGR